MTKLHDEMKASFDTQIGSVSKWIGEKSTWLSGHEIKNTMSGVKSQLDAFFKYKSQEKAAKLVEQMDITALFDDLALRLTNNKRPPYAAPITVEALEKSFIDLAQVEVKTSQILHAELARQNKLLRQNDRVNNEADSFIAWLSEKIAAVDQRPEVSTLEQAEVEVDSHNVLEESNKSTISLRVNSINKNVDELAKEKFESIDATNEKKAKVEAEVETLSKKSEEKKAWVNITAISPARNIQFEIHQVMKNMNTNLGC